MPHYTHNNMIDGVGIEIIWRARLYVTYMLGNAFKANLPSGILEKVS